MVAGFPFPHIHEHLDHLHSDPNFLPDPDGLQFVDYPRIAASPHGPASSPPPPPYEIISDSLSYPHPPRALRTSSNTDAVPVAVAAGPFPQHFLNDLAFSPDPLSNPHFIMTPDEQICPAPLISPNMRNIPLSLQPACGAHMVQPERFFGLQPAPYATSASRAMSHGVAPYVHLPPRPPPTSRTLPPAVSASSMFPIYPMWRPPAMSPSSSTDSESESIASSCSSHSLPTPGASPPSSTSSSNSSPLEPSTPPSSTIPTPFHAQATEDKSLSPISSTVGVSATSQTSTLPRSSSPAPPPRTLGKDDVSASSHRSTVAIAALPPEILSRNNSAPEQRTHFSPALGVLNRSVTAPTRAPGRKPELPTHTRSQSQTHAHDQRGRSIQQNSTQSIQRTRSRRPSVSAPRDLDRIDELDETDPRGLAWHHGGPYEAARSMSQRKADADCAISDLLMHGSQSAGRGRRATHKSSMPSLSVEPGQIFPSAALYQAVQAPYLQSQPSAQAYHSSPGSVKPQDHRQYLADQQQVEHAHEVSPLPGQMASRHLYPRQEMQSAPTQAPYERASTIPMVSVPPTFDSTLRPPLQQRPSQRSHVRFESPTRPEVRPPADQGSVDENPYDGCEIDEPIIMTLAPRVLESVQRASPRPYAAVSGDRHQSPRQVNARPITMSHAQGESELQNEPITRTPATSLPKPDASLLPRHPAPSVQSQASLPPRHIPKQLVMPTPLRPLEDRRKAGAALQAQQQSKSTRSEDEHGVRDGHIHRNGQMLQHETPKSAQRVSSSQTPTNHASQGRAQAIPISAGPNLLRKRGSTTTSKPAGDVPASSGSAALFAAQVVQPSHGVGKSKVVEKMATAVWSKDDVRKEPRAQILKEKKVGRKLSKLTRT
ncbi:uncharacterized protein FIBRA_06373 [Fibroporia radiculosa]|uniref:Uncharacterized protein n=1 Tax=Fibroporia radiculosa TaxID=599839 RepID=J4HZ03_9APHY|nr:uncharacterized protein FIBRA_06373 [Fibroporia radiculosa]CCM04207.1 predicted protein [Fibroporia radiculosa]